MKADKTFYDKKIVYLDYYERGEKIKNGGFVKWEAKGDSSRIQIHIRGLYATDTLQGEIRILSAGESYAADNLLLNFGTGEYASIWKNDNLAQTGVAYDGCDGLVIRLSENRLLRGQWRESVKPKALTLDEGAAPRETVEAGEETVQREITEAAKEPVQRKTTEAEEERLQRETLEAAEEPAQRETAEAAEEPLQRETAEAVEESMQRETAEAAEEPLQRETAEAAEESMQRETAEIVAEEPVRREAVTADEEPEQRETDIPDEEAILRETAMASEAAVLWESTGTTEEIPPKEIWRDKEPVSGKAGMQEKKIHLEKPGPREQTLLSSDKWEQLHKQYPRIHPFGDSREYLSITPRDFVILSRKYQNLVQNSFLLHGYYNYGHVILTRLKERDEESFYLGVPGVYFDREKQAALMFGFEGFEAGCEQISEGGFGYYMKRVEI